MTGTPRLDGVFGRMVGRLPSEGILLIATDLQGNLVDFERMIELYHVEARQQPTVLAFCGDLIHGPPPELQAPGAWPWHLGTRYEDASAELLLRFEELIYAEQVLSVMGNHEHAHVGGPVVPKFYPDEAAVLDASLGPDRDRICGLIRTLPLMVVAECGVVLTHGAPRYTAPSIEAFEALSWGGYEQVPILQMVDRDPLGALLWARGCDDASALDLLEVVTGRRSGVVVHGHDIVRTGYDREGEHHIVVSTSFALLDRHKTYVRLDLSARYESTRDLQEGQEILPLYP